MERTRAARAHGDPLGEFRVGPGPPPLELRARLRAYLTASKVPGAEPAGPRSISRRWTHPLGDSRIATRIPVRSRLRDRRAARQPVLLDARRAGEPVRPTLHAERGRHASAPPRHEPDPRMARLAPRPQPLCAGTPEPGPRRRRRPRGDPHRAARAARPRGRATTAATGNRAQGGDSHVRLAGRWSARDADPTTRTVIGDGATPGGCRDARAARGSASTPPPEDTA